MSTAVQAWPAQMVGTTVDMVYGDTGTTKTTQLGYAAEYWMRKTGKPSRLISSDTGGWATIQDLVSAGVVIPFALLMQREFLVEDMEKLSQGWWPKDPKDPLSPLAPPDLRGIACNLFDGATSWCQMMMTYHEAAVEYDANYSDKDTGAKGGVRATTVRVPEMPRNSFIKSGGYLRRFTGRSDYGGVQARIKEFIRNTAMLSVPGVWTALETKGADEGKKPVYGPDFIGQAMTGVSGPWFGNMIHMDFVAVEKIVENPALPGTKFTMVEASPLMFLRSHIDSTDPFKTPYMAKPRAPRTLWSKVPNVMAPRIDKFYVMLDELAAEEARSTKAAMDRLVAERTG